jgi:ATP-dependent Clp protease protease subunit
MEDLIVRAITIEEIKDFTEFNEQITMLESISDAPIDVYICSPGGSMYTGFAIAGRMAASHCEINTHIYGSCMSSAVLPAIIGTTRCMSSFSYLMIHEASVTMNEAKGSEVTKMMSQLEMEEDRYYGWLAEYSCKSKKYWKDRVGSKDIYLTPEEALELELVDYII